MIIDDSGSDSGMIIDDHITLISTNKKGVE